MKKRKIENLRLKNLQNVASLCKKSLVKLRKSSFKDRKSKYL